MHTETIGIILPWREWKRLIQKKSAGILNQLVCHFAKMGEDFGLKVLFFNINNIYMEELKGDAISLEEGEFSKNENVSIPPIIYNPTNFHQQKNLNKLYLLAQQEEIIVINEQNTLSKKIIRELMQSYPDLENYTATEEMPLNSSFIHVVAQKGTSNDWITHLVSRQDSDHNVHPNEDLLENHSSDNIYSKINEISLKFLRLVHYYFPGIHELGLKFVVCEEGKVQLEATCPILDLLIELQKSDRDLLKKIIKWPFELGTSMLSQQIKEEWSSRNTDSKEDVDGFLMEQNDLGAESTNQKMSLKNLELQTWVKFIEYFDVEDVIKVPERVKKILSFQPDSVKFGIKEVDCKFITYDDQIPYKKDFIQSPIPIFVSTSLLKKMQIPLECVYQLRFTNETCIVGPSIGLLLGEKNFQYHLKYMEKFTDRFGDYEKFGGLVIAFSPRSVDWEEKIAYGMVYDPQQKKWKYGSAPIPAVLYRRNFHQNESHIRQLIKLTGNQLFNSYHFKKSDLFELQEVPRIHKHIPKTYFLKSNIEDLIRFLKEEGKVILKPASLSRGRGILILEETKNHEYILYDYQQKDHVVHYLYEPEQIYKLLESLNVFEMDYIFQTYIPLLRINGRPFDIRVVMQKANRTTWNCSGIECRVAGENEVITNIARGGEAITLEEAISRSHLNLPYYEIRKHILKICHKFCKKVEKKDQHFGEFGLDIALDQEGYPWILEANIFPSFKGFKKMDYEQYLKIRYQPFYYAVRLQNFEVFNENTEIESSNKQIVHY
ncbi:YheC/YheD family protein [Bacillus dakarensis]|uniref:YheC/YheD family endospore coat-associated protein n=1 Tax=Robertmurraya dakarensis TaxID=1926278 RepID=UPI000981C5E8|nr:YheC/YheD family protein [Bacillus dakarensis]